MQNATPAAIAVLVLELAPAAVFGFAGERVARACARWPSSIRTTIPALCALPYILISLSHQIFSWKWCALYAVLPVAIAWLLAQAAIADPEQHGNWRDAIILLTLGLAVDLRWLERAWPSGLAGWGKLLLVDAGLYGFVAADVVEASLQGLEKGKFFVVPGLRYKLLVSLLRVLPRGVLHFVTKGSASLWRERRPSRTPPN